jgi:hypothetical protein
MLIHEFEIKQLTSSESIKECKNKHNCVTDTHSTRIRDRRRQTEAGQTCGGSLVVDRSGRHYLCARHTGHGLEGLFFCCMVLRWRLRHINTTITIQHRKISPISQTLCSDCMVSVGEPAIMTDVSVILLSSYK